MSIRKILEAFYKPEDAQNQVIDRAGLISRLDSHRRTVFVGMAAIFLLVFAVACGGIWLSLAGSMPESKTAPFLGGVTFIALIEIMRRLTKQWTYLGLLLISAAVADEGQLRAMIERIMDATESQPRKKEKDDVSAVQ